MAVEFKTVGEATLAAMIPGGTMLLGGLLMFFVTIQPRIQAVMQNLAAGILLAAVMVELVPILEEANVDDDGFGSFVGMCVGWCLAIAVMFGVKHYMEKIEGGDEEEDVEATKPKDRPSQPLAGTTGDSPSGMAIRLSRTLDTSSGVLPWSLIFVVSIDAAVDGFLIGLAYVASAKAGLMLAAATCIEMGFLGLTFAATCRNVTTGRTAFLLVWLPPSALVLAGFLGSIIADAIEGAPAVYAGFIAFGVVALLFLITQELLLEAQANQDHEALWWVNVWLFLGILLVLVVETFLPEEESSH